MTKPLPTLEWNGHTLDASQPELADADVAAQVLALTPDQPNHPEVARLGWERIMALSTERDRLVELLFLADAALMQLNGCFPLSRLTMEDRFIYQVCKAVRAETSDDYQERMRRVEAWR